MASSDGTQPMEGVQTEGDTSQATIMPPSVSVITDAGKKTYIIRDEEAMQRLMDDQRIMNGQKPMDQVREEIALAQQDKEEAANVFKIPADKFSDFKEVTPDNEEEFDYVINMVLIQFFETYKDRALEFPSIIDSNGRARIHVHASFLGAASHSMGSKTRRILVYPRTMFKEKQEKEARDQEKEEAKIRDRLKAANWAPDIPDNPVTIRD